MKRSSLSLRLESLESLESRRAPATLVDAKTVTFKDPAGDTATIVVSKPILTDAALANAIFTFDTGNVNGDNSAAQQLQTIDMRGFGNGLGVTVTGKDANGNPTKVDVGFVNATGVDLKSVAISGDLGRVIAGDAKPKTTGLGALTVDSIGVKGTTTQAAGGDLNTTITGALGKVAVAGDINAAFISVAGRIGPIHIGGSLVGGADDYSGSIQTTGNVGAIVIGGNVTGGDGQFSGVIEAKGVNFVSGSISSVTIGGNLVGGVGDNSAAVLATKNIGKVSVKSIAGGAGSPTAAIEALGRLSSVTVLGNVTGGTGDNSGEFGGIERLGPVHITGSLIGGSGADSGEFGGFAIGPVTIDGSVVGGTGDRSASIAALGIDRFLNQAFGRLTSVKIAGDVTGGSGGFSASILAGPAIGKITVGGNWTGASISAGWDPGPDGFLGTADDYVVAANSKISAIAIGGKVDGTAAAGDQFAFEASKVGSLKVNGAKVALKSGPKNDVNVPLGTQGDFILTEK
jgi:hypothetical protein